MEVRKTKNPKQKTYRTEGTDPFCVAVHGLSVCQKKFAYATPFTRCSLSSPCSLPHLDENRGTREPNFCFCLTFLETGKTETDIVRNVDISTSTARLTEDFSFLIS